MITADVVNRIYALLTIIGQVYLLIFAVYLFILKKRDPSVMSGIKKYAFPFAFFITLLASLGSLIYSEIIGFQPCSLCWYQRIFMYPQVVLLGLAWLKNEKIITDYVLSLSVIGFIIAVYHYLLQIGTVPAEFCPAIGYAASCTEDFVLRYGYITLPMMSATVFLMVIGVMSAYKIANSR